MPTSGNVDENSARFPGVEVQENCPWVDAGAVVTSAGISAGIGMSLHLVERLAGRREALNELRLEEHKPGLFFASNGEVLDMRATPPTFMSIKLQGAAAGK